MLKIKFAVKIVLIVAEDNCENCIHLFVNIYFPRLKT